MGRETAPLLNPTDPEVGGAPQQKRGAGVVGAGDGATTKSKTRNHPTPLYARTRNLPVSSYVAALSAAAVVGLMLLAAFFTVVSSSVSAAGEDEAHITTAAEFVAGFTPADEHTWVGMGGGGRERGDDETTFTSTTSTTFS